MSLGIVDDLRIVWVLLRSCETLGGTASRFERRKSEKPNAVDRSRSSVALPGSIE